MGSNISEESSARGCCSTP